MAPSIVGQLDGNDAIQGEVFLPGQIFVFGGFVLWANSLSRLEQIDSYAPRHQVRFGNLNYTADIRGDLIFDGFRPTTGAPNSHDEHGLDLLSDNTRDIAPTGAPDLNPGQIALTEDGWMAPAMKAACSSVVEPNTDSAAKGICITGHPDLCSDVGSEPRAPGPIKSDWAPIMEFIAADIFQHSPFGDVLNSLRSLSLCQEIPCRTMSNSSGKQATKKFVNHPPPT